jgi:segregation and condensation protein A
MAATLIEIKSRLLLPQTQVDLEEEDDPRAELAKRLLAYEQMKQAAFKLDELPQAGRDFDWVQFPFTPEIVTKLPEVSIADLKKAWLMILSRAQNHQAHTVQQEILSVRGQMQWILSELKHKIRCVFHELFVQGASAALVVTNFIAILELVKENKICLEQEYACGPITILAQAT